MEPTPSPQGLPTELLDARTQRLITRAWLEGTPQPGSFIDVEGQTYAILERRHRYQFRAGRYRLHRILLLVKPSEHPAEQSLLGDRWVIGDIRCRFNARSELLRCAVNPEGPCHGCRHFAPTVEEPAA